MSTPGVVSQLRCAMNRMQIVDGQSRKTDAGIAGYMRVTLS